MHFLPLAFFLFFSAAPDPDADFFLAQARAEPELRIEDAYKWLFQAARGGEHAIADEAAAQKWLAGEWATLGPPQPNEPLWIPLVADGRIGRLNLRPYRAQSGDLAALHAAFLASVESYEASPVRFRAAWNAIGRSLRKRPLGHLTHAEWRRFDGEMRVRGYPACHHSPEYVRARTPAYRVLTTVEARPLIDRLAR